MRSGSGSMHALVEDALGCVAKECPQAYRAMQSALGARRITLGVDTEECFEVVLAFSDGSDRKRDNAITIQTTTRTLHDVLVGERDPLDAILADDIVVHGGADDLVALGEVGLFFVKGAVRCTSMQPLLERLRQMSSRVSLLGRGGESYGG